MNDKENLERKESNRYRVLKLFYDEIGDKYQQGVTLDQKIVIRYLSENEGISQEELEEAFNYLINENLLVSLFIRAGRKGYEKV
jgi:DNA-binding MarR family transcriptional regulator